MTGTRAEYGLLRGTMKRIKHSRNPSMDLRLIVTGTHISGEFGHTADEIIRDGFKIDSTVRILSKDDSGLGMARSLGKAVDGLAGSLAKLSPDILVILGDRLEVLAAALAATYMNIPIAHIHGGDVSGSVDQPVRYATSKLAHLHLVATPQAAARLKAIGEDERRIFVTGAPGLDEVTEKSYTDGSELARKYGLDLQKPLLILVQHPVVTEEKDAEWQITQTLMAIEEQKIQTVIIFPNADAGGRSMIRVIKQHCKKHQGFLKAVPSVPRQDFLGLMAIASAMVGNSSSGIIEAASFRLPVVNIGTRQLGRERADNVIDVPYDKDSIFQAIRKALGDEQFLEKVSGAENPYGDGRAAKRIVEILQQVDMTELWPKK